MKKKLIEVALPLDVINKASSREKSIRHGHPSTLHLWWARRHLATARAVLFSSLVDDPSEHPEKFPTVESQEVERERLFKIIEDLVKWENSSNEKIFSQALDEIKNSCGENLPAVFDPFAGGGTIPLEAQRLGLKSFASDLNPVAVMINKAMIELPAKFKNSPPVNPDSKNSIGNETDWHGANGLAADILYYGKLLKSLAEKKIGRLYPKIFSEEHQKDLTVIAWLWARTVTCSNPSCKCQMPLVHSFKLSAKQNIFAKPVISGDKFSFEIVRGNKNIPEGTVSRNGAKCLFCNSIVSLEHIRSEGKKNLLSSKLMAIVAEGDNGRIYLAPTEEHEKIAQVKKPDDFPDSELEGKAKVNVGLYGFDEWHKLFTNRQLTALTTFSDLISEIHSQVIEDGGTKNYSDAIAVYLAFLVDQLTNHNTTMCSWNSVNQQMRSTFSRQAIPMSWDFAECNIFSNSTGSYQNLYERMGKALQSFGNSKYVGEVFQHNALEKFSFEKNVMVSTDPPYYDNINYADLSEFFYVWLRQTLKNIYPKIFGRMSFEKNSELIANPYRHDGNKIAAKNFFEDGMFQALKNIFEISHEDFPTTIYYAFRQKDSDDASSGWETMLTSLIRAGFQITGTWPMRTERTARTLAIDSNALASSIVLACRKRPAENKIFDKGEFINALKVELKEALTEMQKATIAPVDMAQAAIGPGIGVYSRYEKITDMNDNELTVREALRIINAELAEFFGTQTGRLDAASQFCVELFTQSGFNDIIFGDADVLARAKNISAEKIEEIGAIISERGTVRLRDRDEMDLLDDNKQLKKDFVKKLVSGNCAWLWVQNSLVMFEKIGVDGAAELLAEYEGSLESLKNLAYRLYNICEKNNWSKEGTIYNDFVMEWQEILTARLNFVNKEKTEPTQEELNFQTN